MTPNELQDELLRLARAMIVDQRRLSRESPEAAERLRYYAAELSVLASAEIVDPEGVNA